MTEWKTYKLGDVVNILDNRRIPLSAHEREQRHGEYPYYGAQGIIDYVDDYLFDGTYLLIAEDGENLRSKKQNIAQLVSGKYWVNNHAHILESNGLCDIRYICYLLNIIDISGYITGSAQPKLNQANLLAISFSLPPLEEQRRIAGILGAIDDKIENNRRINTNLELQAQALYKQWFVDFEFPNEEGKPYKSSGGKMADSELGQIPEGWSVGKLEDIGDIIGGGTPSKAVAEYYTKNGIAWITPKDLSVSHLKFTAKGETDITELGYKNSSAKIIPRGSVLFSSRAPIGYISIAKNDICTNQGFKSVVPNNGCTAFVYYFLLSNTENIESKATGSTFKEASGALMKSLDLVIPSDDILEKFENIMSPIFESQEKFEAENETLATLRDTLLPKLMNGEIKL
ncbi:MAG: restriction endonuclease subunit S [Alistipes sp.]|nr:restriction endonuclease subunit S [Alistipes sp.]